MDECRVCPRNCGVNRENGELGFCGCGSKMVIARYSLHMWEEPCLSGTTGSGTIFFSGCNLKCCFCQNYDISFFKKGRIVDVDEFCDICLELQEAGAWNINLVTGVMYVPLIIDGIVKAKARGLVIPVVYNSSGYENVDVIRSLEGIVDVYLPDFKYYNNNLALKYSKCNDYFESASASLAEMYRQVGRPLFDNEGRIIKGVIVRHLILPGCYDDSKLVIKYLFDIYHNNIFFSIMNQYTPIGKLDYDELNGKVDDNVYEEIIDYAYDLGVRNAFIQEGETQLSSFIPDFDEFKAI